MTRPHKEQEREQRIAELEHALRAGKAAQKTLQEALSTSRKTLNLLAGLDKTISRLDGDKIIGSVLDFIVNELKIPHASIALRAKNKAGESGFRIHDTRRPFKNTDKGSFIPQANTVLSEAIRAREPLYRPDIFAWPSHHETDALMNGETARSDFLVPLISEGKCIAVLFCASGQVNGIPPEQREILVWLAPRLVHPLQRARLIEKEKKSRTELEHLYHTAPIGLCLMDTDLRFVSINESLAAINGRWISEHLDRSLQEVLPELFPQLEPIYRRVIETGEPALDFEVHGITPAEPETERDWLVSYYPLKADTGDVLGVSTIVQDITERKQAAEALRRSEEEFRALFEQAAVGVAKIDSRTGQFTTINQKYCDIVGYTLAEMEKLSFPEITHPEDIQPDLDNMELLRQGKIRDFSMEKRYFHKNGSTVWVTLTVSPFWASGEEPDYHIAVVEDITERKQAEKALRESEVRLSEAQRIAHLGNWEWNLEKNTVAWPDEAFQILGQDLQAGELRFSEFINAVHPADRAMVQTALRETVDCGKAFQLEFRAIQPNGEERTIKAHAELLHDADHVPVKLMGTALDITERKQGEREQDRLRQRLESLWKIARMVDADHHTICELVLREMSSMTESPYGFYAFLNDDESLITAYSWSREVMRDCENHDKPLVFSVEKGGIWAQAIHDRKPFLLNDYQAEHLGKKGVPEGHVPLSRIMAVPVFMGNRIVALGIVANKPTEYTETDAEQVGAFLNNAQIIQAKRQADETVVTSEARFKTLVETISNGVAVYEARDNGRDFIFVDFNPAAERIDNIKKQDLLGRSVLDIFPGIKEFGLFEVLQRVWRTGTPEHLPSSLYRDDRIVAWRENEVYKLSSGEIVAVYDDITKSKRMEERLRQSQKMEAIGTLAGGIAHDFNNILFAVLGYAELGKEDVPKDSQIYANLQKIINAGKRASNLVRQILAFSRQTGQTRIPMRLQPVIEEVLGLLRNTLPATIEIRQEIDPGCGVILADLTQIHQVIMNLCTNAYHAMRREGGVLTVTLYQAQVDAQSPRPQPDLPDGAYACLTVSDTGHGMDGTTLERIFEPYFTTKEFGQGTGLGLATVHGIVAAHDGVIGVESAPGAGAAFRVFFPIIEQGISQDMEKPALEASLASVTGRVLFVDDEELLVGLGKKVLEKMGCTVTTVTNGKDALEMFQAGPDKFDIVVTDQTMPRLTGVELARKILEIRPDIPIVLATGFSEAVDEHKAKSLGIREFIMKPLSVETLARTVSRLLGQGNT